MQGIIIGVLWMLVCIRIIFVGFRVGHLLIALIEITFPSWMVLREIVMLKTRLIASKNSCCVELDGRAMFAIVVLLTALMLEMCKCLSGKLDAGKRCVHVGLSKYQKLCKL